MKYGSFERFVLAETSNFHDVKITPERTVTVIFLENGVVKLRSNESYDRIFICRVETKLAWANLAKNTMKNVYGFSPNQLVFGRNPVLPIIENTGLPAWDKVEPDGESLRKHLKALKNARIAFVKAEAATKVKKALMSKVRTVSTDLERGDIVYYRRDRDGEWKGPAKVIFQDSKIVFIRHGGSVIKASINRVVKKGEEFVSSPAPQDEGRILGEGSVRQEEEEGENLETSSVLSFGTVISAAGGNENIIGQNTNEAQNNPVELEDYQELTKGPVEQEVVNGDWKDKKGKIIIKRGTWVTYHDGDMQKVVKIIGQGKAKGGYRNYLNVVDMNGKQFGLNGDVVELTQTCEEDHIYLAGLGKGDKRILQAKKDELEKLRKYGTYVITDDDENKAKISTTWVITEKKDKVKASLVARGYEEFEDIKTESPTMNNNSFRALIMVAAARGWELRTLDVQSAFLQGMDLDRTVLLKPPKEAGVEKGKVWLLRKCLYGLCDASRQWYMKVLEVLKENGCWPSAQDNSVFTCQKDGRVIGILGVHVDDFVFAGEEDFLEGPIKSMLKSFTFGKHEIGKFEYTGFEVEQNAGGVTLTQSGFLNKWGELDRSILGKVRNEEKLDDKQISYLRKLVGKLNWLTRMTRPDIGFSVVELSTKFNCGTGEDLRRAMRLAEKVKHEEAKIFMPALKNISDWRMVLYTDASLGSLANGTGSSGGYVLFVMDMVDKRSVCVAWGCSKIKRVVAATLSAEILALQKGLEETVDIREICRDLLGEDFNGMPLIVLTDNQSAVESIYNDTRVAEKRLLRDLAVIKEMVHMKEICKVAWIPGDEMMADALTKHGVDGKMLLDCLRKGRLICNYLTRADGDPWALEKRGTISLE